MRLQHEVVFVGVRLRSGFMVTVIAEYWPAICDLSSNSLFDLREKNRYNI